MQSHPLFSQADTAPYVRILEVNNNCSPGKRTQQHSSHVVGSTFTQVLGETHCVGLNQRRNSFHSTNKGPPVRLYPSMQTGIQFALRKDGSLGPQEMILSYEVILKIYAHLSRTEKFWNKKEQAEKPFPSFETRRIHSIFTLYLLLHHPVYFLWPFSPHSWQHIFIKLIDHLRILEDI